MKKIIVPVDFSSHSEHALKAAALLSKKTDVVIYALHMLDLQEISLSQSPEFSQEKAVFFLKMAEKKFKDFLQKDFLNEVNVVPVVKHYKVFSEINEIAKEINADLIIMGSQGATGLKEFFTGSNTEKVIRHSEVPVLVIKNELNDVDFTNIVFATDFSEESIPAYKKMLKTLEFLDAKKHLLYVNLPNENFKTTPEMDALANNFLMKAEGNIDRLINVNYFSAKSIEEGILSYSNAAGADLITLITHGRTGLAHLFSGSISEDVSNHANLPIMTFKM
ncbi:universal stress protein UspA [Polaribacter reichenbachii]|uniref:Universal stress protein UspA n=1 Tax=Polaribacter reichenbachii TaxID=996801 RepID=A0A1B8TVS2_9FLAO|nr:universal stress protein [Polaribacter reichenbachii]APZ45283.1 universal stress protein UspA [Polaribacter reichenbachii]AUC19145.1 universal stress protein UspA [Polaribacter reichenbachii]OBY63698.1 universal stress protein UspA [Polaribacter reichenbachii]